MIAFIDDHREAYGVEPICKVLPIAPSTYHAHVAQRIDASKRSARARRDAALKIEVRRVFAENFGVYSRGRSGGSCGIHLPASIARTTHDGSTTLGIRSGDAAVSKRPRPRSRSLPAKRTDDQYRHHLRAAASIIASTAPFTASSSIGSTSASSYAIACKNCERSPGRSSAAARRTDANCVSVKCKGRDVLMTHPE